MTALPIQLDTHTCTFRPWKPGLGQVFTAPFALDIETTLIDQDCPWQAPDYVLGAACDGKSGYFITSQHLADFLAAHPTTPIAFHNATFDLKVMHRLAPTADVYERVEQHRVWDTLLLHRLHMLGSEGNTAFKKGQATLEHCTQTYLGCTLPKDTKDTLGNDVRTSFGRYLGQEPRQIEPIYLDYLAKDALATILVFKALIERLENLLQTSSKTWGYVSAEWLAEQTHLWGPQTHHIQLKGAIALDAITANGIGLDLSQCQRLLCELGTVVSEKEAALKTQGYHFGKDAGNSLQELIASTLQDHPELTVPRTETGKYSTTAEDLSTLASVNPVFRDLLDYKSAQKLCKTYLSKMNKDRLHPRFDALKNTGRTSSFGDINAQNLPRDDSIRGCFVPAQGHLFLDVDYSTIEMATLAQAVLRQFGGSSHMADAINAGKDLHRLVAAKVTDKPENEVTDEERSKAKPINFGKPGGMGTSTLRNCARTSYGLDLSESEVADLEAAWFDLFPEMETFLSQEDDAGYLLAATLNLTPAAYRQVTNDKPWHRRAPEDDEPTGWLGGMCLKVLRSANPMTVSGKPYLQEQINYFWEQCQELAEALPSKHRQALLERQPSDALSQEVRNCLTKKGVFTLTGRLRGPANYCARHNTVFQGLAADGAKLALWRLWRAGYHVANFIHDQVLIEVTENAKLQEVAEDVESIMVDSMREVVPEVLVKVDWSYRQRWSKLAEDKVDIARGQEGSKIAGQAA